MCWSLWYQQSVVWSCCFAAAAFIAVAAVAAAQGSTAGKTASSDTRRKRSGKGMQQGGLNARSKQMPYERNMDYWKIVMMMMGMVMVLWPDSSYCIIQSWWSVWSKNYVIPSGPTGQLCTVLYSVCGISTTSLVCAFHPLQGDGGSHLPIPE